MSDDVIGEVPNETVKNRVIRSQFHIRPFVAPSTERKVLRSRLGEFEELEDPEGRWKMVKKDGLGVIQVGKDRFDGTSGLVGYLFLYKPKGELGIDCGKGVAVCRWMRKKGDWVHEDLMEEAVELGVYSEEDVEDEENLLGDVLRVAEGSIFQEEKASGFTSLWGTDGKRFNEVRELMGEVLE